MEATDFGLDYYLRFGHNNDNIGTVIRNLPLIARAKKTLIAPCGYGQMVRYLNDFGHDCDGIDINPELVERRIDESVALGRIESIPHAANRYDLVLCCDVLEHLDVHKIKLALNEIDRITTRDSFLVLRVGTDVLDVFDEDPTHRTRKDDRWWLKQVVKETDFLPHTYSAAIGEYVFSKKISVEDEENWQHPRIHSAREVSLVGEPGKRVMHLANHKTGEEIHFHYRADNRMGCERYIPRLGLKRCIVSLTPDASDSLVELSLHDDGTFKVEGCEIVMSDMVGLGPFSMDDIKIVI